MPFCCSRLDRQSRAAGGFSPGISQRYGDAPSNTPRLSMRIDRHFYIAMLPALGELGGSAPMGLADLLEHVAGRQGWREQLEAMALLDDLLQRESLLAGQIEEAELAVLSLQQAHGEAPLPSFLETPTAGNRTTALQSDLLWERYFRYAHRLARARGSRFLGRWIEFEIALRNAVAATRAKRLGLEPSDYQVAADLAASDEELASTLSEWEAARTPLDGLRVMLRARWSWLDRHDAWYSFSVDELLAYAARVMVLQQWRRIEETEDVKA